MAILQSNGVLITDAIPSHTPAGNEAIIAYDRVARILYTYNSITTDWEVAVPDTLGDSDWLKVGDATTPDNDDTMYHEGLVVIGSDSEVRDGVASLQIENIAEVGGSALDIYTNADYVHAVRFYNTQTWGGENPSTFINGVGALHTSMWILISAAHTGSGASYTLVAPTEETYMLGIMSDIPGACIAARQSSAEGSYLFQGLDQAGNTTFKLEADGSFRWGVTTTEAMDTDFGRDDAGVLRTTGSLLVDTNLHIGDPTAALPGKLNVTHNDSEFYVTDTFAGGYPEIYLGGSSTSVAGVFRRITASASIYFGEQGDTGGNVFRGNGGSTFAGETVSGINYLHVHNVASDATTNIARLSLGPHIGFTNSVSPYVEAYNSDASSAGLRFGTYNSGLATRLNITPDGKFIAALPTYADDAAAGAGGEVANTWYKTATGELRIKL